MKILMISPKMPPLKCGLGDYTTILSQRLTQLGHVVDVLTIAKARPPEDVCVQHEYEIKYIVDNWNWSALKLLIREIKTSKSDWVNIQYSIASYSNFHPMITFLPMILKLFRIKSKVLVTIHEITPPQIFTKMFKVVDRLFGFCCMGLFLLFADKIAVCSNWVFGELNKKTFILGKRFKNKIYFLPVGSNIVLDKSEQEETSKKYDIIDSDFIICFFGFIRPGRGLDVIIRAYKLLLDDGYDMKFIVLGGFLDLEYTNQLKKMSKELGIDHRIIWTGMLSSAEVSHILTRVNICFSINTNKGISLNSGSFHAAAIHGLPIIANRGKYCPEGLFDGENIFFVDSSDDNEFKKAVVQLYGSTQLREKLGYNIKKYAEKFTWEEIAKELVSNLELTLG